MMRTVILVRLAGAGAAAAFLLCGAAAADAAPRPGGPPHMSGGAARMGGGAPHFAPHIGGGAPHFAPHVGGGMAHFAPHVGAVPHFARAPHFAPHAAIGRRIGRIGGAPHARIGRLGRSGARGLHGPARTTRLHPFVTGPHRGIAASRHRAPTAGRTASLRSGAPRLSGRTDPGNFATHRHLAGVGAFRPFFGHHWHRHGHLGWVGPWFWPYAYGDIFYDALWPYAYAYDDPFWVYGYDDVYEGIFSPYDYQPYVEGAGAPARMTALREAVGQSCADEAAEVTGWPIDQIQAAVSPDRRQTALLDALGNAVVKASDEIKTHCPTAVAFTPPDRLAQMQERLTGLVQAVAIVQPPLAKFYDSLSDEQKARFNDIAAGPGKPSRQSRPAQNPQAACGENAPPFPADKIDQVVRPDDAQRAKLGALAAASAKAADLIGASCPSALPATPPDRLAAEGKHLQAMLAAVQTIRPPLDAFYASLSDEQKARFNTIGRQLFAQK